MRDGSHVRDAGNIKAGTLERADSRFTAAARSLNEYLYLTQAVLHSFAGGVISR